MLRPSEATRDPSWYTVYYASILLGIDDNTAYRIVAAGLLRAERTKTAGKRRRRRPYGHYRIREKWLHQFAADPRCWLFVRPQDIPDPALQRIAVRAWRGLGEPRWYRAEEIAQRYHVSGTTVRAWRRAGWAFDQWHQWGPGYYLLAVTPPPPPTEVYHAA